MRIKSGLLQEEVAKRLGCTQGAVSQWENGICLPSAELIPKIAALYRCTIDELYDNKPENIKLD